ncbi:MAG: hypothetical protein HY049_17615 [Acidobacteria bacterium]|nr:hypothetical protein [Acidobacteriota bacterium]
MPAARLQPLPFPDPARLLDLIEQEPSLIEAGLTLVARRLPIPVKGDAVTLDGLAYDARGRCVAIRAVECLTPRSVEQMLVARGWIAESLETLRALSPQLAKCGNGARALLMAGSVEPAAATLLAHLASGAPEVLEVHAFELPTGLALHVTALTPIPAGSARPAAPAPSAKPAPIDREMNPLAGIPLTSDELAEFRRLSMARPQAAKPGASGEGRVSASFSSANEVRGGFLEN